jgi:hypothetical protein
MALEILLETLILHAVMISIFVISAIATELVHKFKHIWIVHCCFLSYFMIMAARFVDLVLDYVEGLPYLEIENRDVLDNIILVFSVLIWMCLASIVFSLRDLQDRLTSLDSEEYYIRRMRAHSSKVLTYVILLVYGMIIYILYYIRDEKDIIYTGTGFKVFEFFAKCVKLAVDIYLIQLFIRKLRFFLRLYQGARPPYALASWIFTLIVLNGYHSLMIFLTMIYIVFFTDGIKNPLNNDFFDINYLIVTPVKDFLTVMTLCYFFMRRAEHFMIRVGI